MEGRSKLCAAAGNSEGEGRGRSDDTGSGVSSGKSAYIDSWLGTF